MKVYLGGFEHSVWTWQEPAWMSNEEHVEAAAVLTELDPHNMAFVIPQRHKVKPETWSHIQHGRFQEAQWTFVDNMQI